MSLHIENCILHLIKRNELEEIEILPRHESLPINDHSESLITDLNRVYCSKSNKGYGTFLPDSEFNVLLSKYRSDEIPFIDFSIKCASLLVIELSKYPFSDVGSLVIAEYQSLATEYLYISIVPSVSGMKVNPFLDINPTEHLDIDSISIAARIDLTDMDTSLDSTRYISFLKGRAGRKVGDFFLDFLGADAGLNVREQNQILVQAVEDFLSESDLEKDERDKTRKTVKEYGKGVLSDNDEVVLSDLSDELPEINDDTFSKFVSDNGYDLEDSFPADKSTLDKLDKYRGSGGGLSITFDAVLLGERVFYDLETDTLTIKGTPPNLRHQIQQRS